MYDLIVIFFAKYLIYILTIAVIGGFLWEKRKDLYSGIYNSVLAVVSAIVARFVAKPIIMLFIERPRPFFVNGTIPLVSEDIIGACCNSFPSGHTLFAFALATIVFINNKKWGIVAYIVALSIGISRVLAGVHWPTDIIGGAIVGIITAYIIWHITAKLREKYKRTLPKGDNFV